MPHPIPDAPDQPLDAASLEHFRDKLRTARRDLLQRNRARLGGVLDQSAPVTDEAEHAVLNNDQQLELRLAGKDRKLLELIEHALGKLDRGEYGLCEGTGEPISRARLELRPWARYSVEHKMVLERERALHARD